MWNCEFRGLLCIAGLPDINIMVVPVGTGNIIALSLFPRFRLNLKKNLRLLYMSPQTEDPNRLDKPAYFPNLDGLRTIACATVVVCHLFVFSFGAWALDYFGQLKADCFWLGACLGVLINGALGVKLFFVLSGFLITYLIKKEILQTGGFRLTHFYVRRGLRIAPLFYLVLVVGLVVFPYFGGLVGRASDTAYSPLLNLFFLGNLDYPRVLAEEYASRTNLIVGVTWSIAVEEQFYLILPLIFVFRSIRTYSLGLLLCLWCAALLFKTACDPETGYYHTFCNVIYLGAGCMAAHIYFAPPYLIRCLQTLPKYLIVGVYIIGLGFISLLGGRLTMLEDLGVSLFFVFVILEQNLSSNSGFKLQNFHFLSSLGKYTYGAYLLHPIVFYGLSAVEDFCFAAPPAIPVRLFLCLLALLLTFCAAYLSYHYFESYFLSKKDKWK